LIYLFIFQVPVGLDPHGLIVDNIVDWFRNPPPTSLNIRWYPGNFTDQNNQLIQNLQLTVYGYKEAQDEQSHKFANTFKKLVILNENVDNSFAYGGQGGGGGVMSNVTKMLNIMALRGGSLKSDQDDLYSFSFGVLKLEIPEKSMSKQQGQG